MRRAALRAVMRMATVAVVVAQPQLWAAGVPPIRTRATEKRQVQFANAGHTSLRIYWEGADSAQPVGDVLLPGGKSNLYTWDGDRFTIRDVSTGSTVDSVTVDSGTSEYSVGVSAGQQPRVEILNERGATLTVWFAPRGGAESAVLDIAAAGSGNIDSHAGHRLLLREKEGAKLVGEIIVTGGHSSYVARAGGLARAPDEAGAARVETMIAGRVAQFRRTIAVRFRNLSGRPVGLWWKSDQGNCVLHSRSISPGAESATNSYVTHRFVVAESNAPDGCKAPLLEITIASGRHMYTYEDGTGSAALLEQWREEEAFSEEYRERTGRAWLAHYPRTPPVLPMREAREIGEELSVETSQPPLDDVDDAGEGTAEACASANITLRALSLSPRVFEVVDFLSSAEADHLISLATNVQRSTTGTAGEPSDVGKYSRTSKNTWLRRDRSQFVDRLFRRAADVLGIDEAALDHSKHAEHMQLVHYDVDERYDAHHDWRSDQVPPPPQNPPAAAALTRGAPTAGAHALRHAIVVPQRADPRRADPLPEDGGARAAARAPPGQGRRRALL